MSYIGNSNYVLTNRATQLPHNYIQNANPTITVNPPIKNMTWLNQASGEIFVCLDNTVGANVWQGSGGTWVAPVSRTNLIFEGLSITGGTLIDSSGNGNDGSMVGVVTAPSILGNNDACIFKYGASRINLSDVLKTPSDFSIALFLFRLRIDTTNQQWVVSRWDSSSKRSILFLLETTGTISFGTYSDSANSASALPLCVSSIIPVGQFVHICVTHSQSGSNRIYVDGILDTEEDAPVYTSVNTPTWIGNVRDVGEVSGSFEGIIDSIRIYDRELAEDEIVMLSRQAGK